MLIQQPEAGLKGIYLVHSVANFLVLAPQLAPLRGQRPVVALGLFLNAERLSKLIVQRKIKLQYARSFKASAYGVLSKSTKDPASSPARYLNPS